MAVSDASTPRGRVKGKPAHRCSNPARKCILIVFLLCALTSLAHAETGEEMLSVGRLTSRTKRLDDGVTPKPVPGRDVSQFAER